MVEAALVAQGVVALVLVLRGRAVADPWTFWGYLVTAVCLLPVAAVWAMADRTRWRLGGAGGGVRGAAGHAGAGVAPVDGLR